MERINTRSAAPSISGPSLAQQGITAAVKQQSLLLSLPHELLLLIVKQFESYKDVRSLAMTCTYMRPLLYDLSAFQTFNTLMQELSRRPVPSEPDLAQAYVEQSREATSQSLSPMSVMQQFCRTHSLCRGNQTTQLMVEQIVDDQARGADQQDQERLITYWKAEETPKEQCFSSLESWVNHLKQVGYSDTCVKRMIALSYLLTDYEPSMVRLLPRVRFLVTEMIHRAAMYALNQSSGNRNFAQTRDEWDRVTKKRSAELVAMANKSIGGGGSDCAKVRSLLADGYLLPFSREHTTQLLVNEWKKLGKPEGLFVLRLSARNADKIVLHHTISQTGDMQALVSITELSLVLSRQELKVALRLDLETMTTNPEDVNICANGLYSADKLLKACTPQERHKRKQEAIEGYDTLCRKARK